MHAVLLQYSYELIGRMIGVSYGKYRILGCLHGFESQLRLYYSSNEFVAVGISVAFKLFSQAYSKESLTSITTKGWCRKELVLIEGVSYN